MPVRKFHSLEEMAGSVWIEAGDPHLARTIAAVWAFGARTARLHFPSGIYRHRTIESANRLRETWDEVNFQAGGRLERREDAAEAREQLAPTLRR